MPTRTPPAANGASPPPPTPPAAPPATLNEMLRALRDATRQATTGDPGQASGLTQTLLGHLLAPSRVLTPPPARPLNTGSLRLPGARRLWWAYLIGGGLLLAVLLKVLVGVIAWGGAQLTTLQYGDPRTTHLAAMVGFPDESAGAPTLITAVNDAGTAHIFVIPGGHVPQTFILAEVLGEDPDGRQPLLLSLQDVDRDGHPDLVATLGDSGPAYVWLFDTGKAIFRVPTADERRRLVLPGGR